MKKKILFVVSNMESGGVSKSMSSLLNIVDTNIYDVDCFILSPQGIFMDSIPKEINIITGRRTEMLFLKFPNNILQLTKSGFIMDACLRIVSAFFMLFNKGIGGWILSRRIHKITSSYDLAVDFNGQHQLYYLIDRIKAKKKVTFFHNDYSKWSYYYMMDKKYMPLTNKIFSVSEECVKSLKFYFPKEENKIALFENISSIDTITNLSQSKLYDTNFDKTVVNLISVGHICKRKGSDIALKAAKILKDRGKSFKWYFIGKNDESDFYEKFVNKNDLQDYIIFLGLKSNPFPYIKQADILVHPSQFEGKSIALDEAKILCKPIVVTNFSTVYDQFTDRVNASICEMNPKDLADKIEELLTNVALRNQYSAYLAQHQKDNTAEIEKLYKLLNTT